MQPSIMCTQCKNYFSVLVKFQYCLNCYDEYKKSVVGPVRPPWKRGVVVPLDN